MTNFGSSKSDLNLRYRLGLEHAIAKADFLNAPDIVLVQALANFLCLARRHDSPRFVWMITGLVIRMAQYLGLQRDGANFAHLSPFEVEIRRRVWWVVLNLDLRASEDQGTDLTIAHGSFDTKIPLNINDTDLEPETKDTPNERDGMTDMSFARWCAGMCDIMRQMMALIKDGAAGLEEQSRLLNEIHQNYEHTYFQHASFQHIEGSENVAYWVGVTVARLVVAKMTLIVYLPILFSFSSQQQSSNEIRTKLLVAAIEVAEYNHALNAEPACRHWQWIYQTYTHWHAIVFLLIEISRRPWSPIVERAWLALHSRWLIPPQPLKSGNLRIWVPLRKLMSSGRRHRDAELQRLRADPAGAMKLEMDDRSIPAPTSSGSLPTGTGANTFSEWWCQLVDMREGSGVGVQTSGVSDFEFSDPLTLTAYTTRPTATPTLAYDPIRSDTQMASEPMYFYTHDLPAGQPFNNTQTHNLDPTIATDVPSESGFQETAGIPNHSFAANWTDGRTPGSNYSGLPWLWADADPSADVFSGFDMSSIDVNMDLEGEVNWYQWIESASKNLG